MARRKNVKRIDPRYFMNEKMERLDEGVLDFMKGVLPGGGGGDAAVAVDVIEQEAEGMMRYPSLGPSPEGDHYGFKSAGIQNEQLGKSIIGTPRTATRPLTLDELVALIAVNKGSPGFPHEKYKEHLENAMHKVRWGLSYVPRDQQETAVSGGTKDRL